MDIQVCFHSKFYVVTYISEGGVSIAVNDNDVHMHTYLSNRWTMCVSNIKNSMLMFIFWVLFLDLEAIKI